jgi:folylpolyglutamate synthase/dihydropteroate synthase
MQDKDYEGMLKEIDIFSDYNIFTYVDNERGLSPDVLHNLSNKDSLIEHEPLKAIEIAKNKINEFDTKSIIIITGSIFLMERIWKDIA